VNGELDDLRAEIERLLAAALASERRHEAELAQRDDNHAAELAQRNHNHAADTERRSRQHEDELREHDQQHAAELEDEIAHHQTDVTNLQQAVQSRDLIGQAKGIIMATMRCTADEAFALLTRQSQAENRKISEIAAEIASRTVRTTRHPY
jgi:hypothetical protein